MAKKRSKKSNKTKIKKTISLIIFILLVIFVIVCYLNPSIYDKLLSIFNEQPLDDDIEKGDFYAKGEATTVIHIIDIGQGDAILIQLPDDKVMLIDTGDNNDDNNQKLVNYIKNLKITTIDYLLATHADADHIGGMEDVFNNFEIKKVFRPYVLYSGDKFSFTSTYNVGATKYKQSSTTYGRFLNYINGEKYTKDNNSYNCEWEFFDYDCDFGSNIHYNDVVTPYTVDFLSPLDDYTKVNYEDANDYSPIIKYSYGTFDILLTGDAEKQAEEEFVNYYSKNDEYKNFVDVDVLKVGHHGSSTSTSKAFLELIKPETSIISCGEGNSYGHPTQPTLDRLCEYGSTLYRTDKNGDIVITVDYLGQANITTQKVGSNMFVAP